MHPVQVEFVILERPVLNRPLFQGALPSDECRRIAGTKQLWSLVVDGDEKPRLRIILGEINHVRHRRMCGGQAREALRHVAPDAAGTVVSLSSAAVFSPAVSMVAIVRRGSLSP